MESYSFKALGLWALFCLKLPHLFIYVYVCVRTRTYTHECKCVLAHVWRSAFMGVDSFRPFYHVSSRAGAQFIRLDAFVY